MRELHVRLPGIAAGYPVLVGRGLNERLVSFLRGRSEALVVISDETVAELHARELDSILRAAGLESRLLTFPPGEPSKSRSTKADLEDRMLAAGVGRDALIVAVGGGVTIDLAGFVAATYMRGVPFVAVPTTTLAMVDAAVGGKTGINVPAGKNLIGAFHRPAGVFCDIMRLGTLPAAPFRAGLAEVVKHGLIGSVVHFTDVEAHAPALLERDPAVLTRIIGDSVAVKVAFVEKDEKEAGARKALNFGHTFGHALEKLSGWKLPHGEAVARGLLFETRLSATCGVLGEPALVERLSRLLESLGLPGSPLLALQPGLGPGSGDGSALATVLSAIRTDKKARAGAVEWVLLESVGRVVETWTRPVPDDAIAATLAAFST